MAKRYRNGRIDINDISKGSSSVVVIMGAVSIMGAKQD